MIYQLEKTGRKSWTYRVEGYVAVGWGSRPDLAIRNWKQQDKLWKSKKK